MVPEIMRPITHNHSLVDKITTISLLTDNITLQVEKGFTFDKNQGTCSLCHVTTSQCRVQIHARQHCCLHFCKCQFSHISRDQVYDRIIAERKYGTRIGPGTIVYKVVRVSHPKLAERLGCTYPPPFNIPMPSQTKSKD